MLRIIYTTASELDLTPQDLISQISGTDADIDLLRTIGKQAGWKAKIYSLHARIAKLCETQSFSAREAIELRQTMRSQKKMGLEFDMLELMQQFPGKTEASLTAKIADIRSRYKSSK